MTLPLIVGQAPSRSGDGTPFSGPSGKRLCQLAGVETLDELQQHFRLDNLITEQMAKHHSGKGDIWDARVAAIRAKEILRDARPDDVLILCGKNVWKAFGGWWAAAYFNSSTFYNGAGLPLKGYLFPHPSGVSHYWNNELNVARAGRFLKRWVTRDE